LPFRRRVISLGVLLTATGGALLARPEGLAISSRPSSLIASAVNSWSAQLEWSIPGASARVHIYRDRRLIDRLPGGPSGSYTDYLLWHRTTYSYTLKAWDGRSILVAHLYARITTPARKGAFPRFYSDSSFWNTPISQGAATDPNSAAMKAASLLPWASRALINNDDAWGIPLAYADPRSRTYDVGCLAYACDTAVSFRIPRYAQPSTGSDGHLAVFDPQAGQELDMWQGAYDARTDSWTAGGRSATEANWGAVCLPGEHCGGGGVAAGFNEFGGAIRPEEIAQGHIDHALVISLPHVRENYISCPAVNIWASRGSRYADDPDAIPLGAHVQLSPAVDVRSRDWPRWEKVVARALQTYGAYVADLDANLTLRGEPNLDRGYDAWAKVGMTTKPHPSLSNLPWKRFRVLKLEPC
jgi:hypothetical protein